MPSFMGLAQNRAAETQKPAAGLRYFLVRTHGKRLEGTPPAPLGWKEQNQDKGCYPSHRPLIHVCFRCLLPCPLIPWFWFKTKKQTQLLHVSAPHASSRAPSCFLLPVPSAASPSCSAPPSFGWDRKPGTSPFPGVYPVTIEIFNNPGQPYLDWNILKSQNQ